MYKDYCINEVLPDGSLNTIEVVERRKNYTVKKYLKECRKYCNPWWIEYVENASLTCEEL